MACLIKFPDGTNWYVTNQAFRQLVDDYAKAFPEDRDSRRRLELGWAINGIAMDELPIDVRNNMLSALENIAKGILAGNLRNNFHEIPNDDKHYGEYILVIRKLLDSVERQNKRLAT